MKIKIRRLSARERRKINRKLPDGWHVSIYGYVRVHRGPRRGMYAQRAVVADLDATGPCKLARAFKDIEVHHLDFNPLHNCPLNLLACDPAINDFMARDSYRSRRALTQ